MGHVTASFFGLSDTVEWSGVVSFLSKPLNIRWSWSEASISDSVENAAPLVTHSEIVEVKEEDIFVLKCFTDVHIMGT